MFFLSCKNETENQIVAVEKTNESTSESIDYPRKVWLDCDLAVGMKNIRRPGFSDVDDGWAFWQLLNNSDKIELVGVSSVFGNTSGENAIMLNHKVNNEFANGTLKIYEGAHAPIDLSNVQTNEAVEAMAEALRKEPLIIAAIGPATNVGLLLLKHPDVAKNIKEVVLVAGRRKHTDYFNIGTKGRHAPDLNFDLDNNAFRVLLESGVPVALCPFEISSKVWMKQADLDRFKTSELPMLQWLGIESQNWINQWFEQGAEGFNPFDILATHYLISPEDIIREKLNAHLEIHIDDTKSENDKAIFKPYLICDKTSGYPVTYCYDVVEGYHEKMIQSLE